VTGSVPSNLGKSSLAIRVWIPHILSFFPPLSIRTTTTTSAILILILTLSSGQKTYLFHEGLEHLRVLAESLLVGCYNIIELCIMCSFGHGRKNVALIPLVMSLLSSV